MHGFKSVDCKEESNTDAVNLPRLAVRETDFNFICRIRRKTPFGLVLLSLHVY